MSDEDMYFTFALLPSIGWGFLLNMSYTSAYLVCWDCHFFICTEPFRAPVEWKALGLYDYPTIVKKPMDLGTVKKNIADRKYKTLDKACEDVRLVWTNCMTYNADGSDFFILAQNLSKKWEEKYAKLISDLGLTGTQDGDGGDLNPNPPSSGGDAPTSTQSTATSNAKISFDDKRNFARSLYKISKEDLGKLIVEVDTKCPMALTKNASEDECELNVDKITPALFHELKQFVQTCIKEASNNPNAGGGPASAGKKKTNSNKRQKTS